PIMLLLVDAESRAERRERLRFASRSDSFSIPCAARPRYVVVDPEMWILGDVTAKAPADMLRCQLDEAKNARGRWLAAQGLAKVDDPPSIRALEARLFDDAEFWGVRNECANALGHIRAREAESTLIRALEIAHPKVRRAVAEALGRFRTTAAVE